MKYNKFCEYYIIISEYEINVLKCKIINAQFINVKSYNLE